MTNKKDYWFSLKTHGWGWGPPMTWQGWMIMALYVGLVLAGVFWILEEGHNELYFVAWIIGLTLMLLGVCFAKGPSPRWRWGED